MNVCIVYYINADFQGRQPHCFWCLRGPRPPGPRGSYASIILIQPGKTEIDINWYVPLRALGSCPSGEKLAKHSWCVRPSLLNITVVTTHIHCMYAFRQKGLNACMRKVGRKSIRHQHQKNSALTMCDDLFTIHHIPSYLRLYICIHKRIKTVVHAVYMYMFLAFCGFAQSIECATQSRNSHFLNPKGIEIRKPWRFRV